MVVPAPAKAASVIGLCCGSRAVLVRPLPLRPRFQLPHQQGPHLQPIMSYKILPWSHDTNKMVHMLLHASALFLGSVGIYAAFKFHNESGIDNLYSFHSWIGLGTICLFDGAQRLLKVSLP